MIQEQYKIQVVQNPESGEISLAVTPGTIGADLAYQAAYAALRQEDNRGSLDEATAWRVRMPMQRLAVVNHDALTTRGSAAGRFEIHGEAAAAVIEGLGALALEAEDSAVGQGAADQIPTTTEETAIRAGIVLGDILDQGHALAEQHRYTQRMAGTIYE